MRRDGNAMAIGLWDGRTVPRLGMGCWAIGGPYATRDGVPLGYGAVDDGESVRAVHRALDLGIRFFDTADVYGAGHLEDVLGRALRGRPEAVVATKFGNRFDARERLALGPMQPGPDLAAQVRHAVEASLARLKRERIDLAQFHMNTFPPEHARPAFDTLEALREEGKVAAYGWSTDFPERAAAFAAYPGFKAVQHGLNLFFAAQAMMKTVEEHDLVSINRSPLGMGLLTGKFRAGDALPENDVRRNTFGWMDYFKEGRVAPELAERLERIRHLLTQGAARPRKGRLPGSGRARRAHCPSPASATSGGSKRTQARSPSDRWRRKRRMRSKR
jgi:aryl-alcohol dehydrogenase-like predicted oxidoreductase